MHTHRQHVHYVHMILTNRELRDMYVAMSLKTLAVSMVGIFIPIFLMVEMGATLSQVITFYMFNTLGYIFFAPFAGKVASKFGLRMAALSTIPLLIFFYLGLFNYSTLGFNLNYLAIMLGITQALYWVPFITHFVRSSDKKHRSEEVGFLSASTIISAMSGPFVGGLIIAYFGFGMLFTFASLLLCVSVFPLMFTRDYHEPFKCIIKDIHKIPKRFMLKVFSFGATNIAEMVFWPVFLFSVVNVYTEFGLIFLIAEFCAFIGSFIFGSVENRKKLLWIMRIGGILCSLVWLSRVFFVGAVAIAAITILGAFLHGSVEIPFNTLEYDRVVKKKYLAEFVVFRHIIEGLGRLAILGIMNIFLDFNAAWISSAVMYLAYLF